MTAHEFGQRVHDDVGTVIDRAQQDGRCDGVIDDQWNALPVRDLRQRLDVADVPGRIPDALAEHRTRILDRSAFRCRCRLDRESAKSDLMPSFGSTWAKSVCVVP